MVEQVKGLEWHSIEGTWDPDLMVVDFEAVEAHEYYVEHWKTLMRWDRQAKGLAGNDLIIRDRAGDYNEGSSVAGLHSGGHVGIFGDDGEDTIHYQRVEGGMLISLGPVGDAYAVPYSDDVQQLFKTPGAGVARALNPSALGHFGDDILHSFENVVGTNWGDLIFGDDDDNSLNGLHGDNSIFAGKGDDTIHGGSDNDLLVGEKGDDLIYGGAGDDTLLGDSGEDTIFGGSGANHIDAGTEDDTIHGGHGDETIFAGSGDDRIYGGLGANVIDAGSGMDSIWGGNDGEELSGNTGTDTIFASGGNDTIDGGEDPDTVYGQGGDDTIKVLRFDTLVDGGAGFDTVEQVHDSYWDFIVTLNKNGNGVMSRAAVPGSWETELKSIEAVVTGDGSDTISFNGFGSRDNKAVSGSGHDDLFMGGGDDTAIGGFGDDTINGHSGDDCLNGSKGDDSLLGGHGEDTLQGKNGDDTAIGGSGDDLVTGGRGSDVIRGGSGDDTLTGGKDADVFVWKDGDTGYDKITDFLLGTDVIDVDGILADPPVGPSGSYVGKVTAWHTGWGSDVALVAETDEGLVAFAYLVGHDKPTIELAIETGELFA